MWRAKISAIFLISYPREEVLLTKYIDEKGKSIIRNIALKNWATVAKASLCHQLLAREFKDVLAREVANKCIGDYTKSLQSNQVKPTPQDYINKLIICNFNPLFVSRMQ